METVGNTLGNTKTRVIPGKTWCFTWNNYEEDDIKWLIGNIGNNKYIFSEEIGESGTKHLQGYIKFIKKCRPLECIKTKKIHWEKCRGSEDDNVKYITKEGGKVYSNFYEELDILKDNELKEWQLDIIEYIKNKPIKREIYWVYDEEGGKGKSELSKYLVAKYNAIVVGGKSADMKYAVMNCNPKPKIIIVDLPRSIENLSYTGIEEIKNGCFASNKYESGMVLMNCPHIIVFANIKPDERKWSKDRVKLIEI